jgi:hypothetical protein
VLAACLIAIGAQPAIAQAAHEAQPAGKGTAACASQQATGRTCPAVADKTSSQKGVPLARSISEKGVDTSKKSINEKGVK